MAVIVGDIVEARDSVLCQGPMYPAATAQMYLASSDPQILPPLVLSEGHGHFGVIFTHIGREKKSKYVFQHVIFFRKATLHGAALSLFLIKVKKVVRSEMMITMFFSLFCLPQCGLPHIRSATENRYIFFKTNISSQFPTKNSTIWFISTPTYTCCQYSFFQMLSSC